MRMSWTSSVDIRKYFIIMCNSCDYDVITLFILDNTVVLMRHPLRTHRKERYSTSKRLSRETLICCECGMSVSSGLNNSSKTMVLLNGPLMRKTACRKWWFHYATQLYLRESSTFRWWFYPFIESNNNCGYRNLSASRSSWLFSAHCFLGRFSKILGP